MKPDDPSPSFPPAGQPGALEGARAACDEDVAILSDKLRWQHEQLAEHLQRGTSQDLPCGPTADELIQAALDEESQKRLWVRVIIPLLQLRSHDPDPSGRVQLAFDLMHIAACERASRLLQSDLPSNADWPRTVHL